MPLLCGDTWQHMTQQLEECNSRTAETNSNHVSNYMLKQAFSTEEFVFIFQGRTQLGLWRICFSLKRTLILLSACTRKRGRSNHKLTFSLTQLLSLSYSQSTTGNNSTASYFCSNLPAPLNPTIAQHAISALLFVQEVIAPASNASIVFKCYLYFLLGLEHLHRTGFLGILHKEESHLR